MLYIIGSAYCLSLKKQFYLNTFITINKYIGDNSRQIYDITAYVEEQQSPGMLLNVDVEKAFDSINWNFMLKVLKAYGFRDNIVKGIDVFDKNRVLCSGQWPSF